MSLILSCLVLACFKTRHGRNIISFYLFLFLTGHGAKCLIEHAVCGVMHVTVAALFCSSSLLCISNSDWATENEAGRFVSRWWDLSPIQFSCNYSYSLITHNKTQVHSTWGLLRVCVACPTPRLNLSSELHPSWEQHPRRVPHRICNGYNNPHALKIWFT